MMTNLKTVMQEIESAVEPRWPVMVALLAAGGIYVAMPPAMALGGRWTLLVLVSVLLVPAVVTHHTGKHRLNMIIGLCINGVVSLFELTSLALLIRQLPDPATKPVLLLQSAAALWLTNVLVFSLWYWRLDGGGPRARHLHTARGTGWFLFPQMLVPAESGEHWMPRYVDYLFLAFNTSTAFSPTDTAILARPAKLLMMAQSLISVAIVALVAARAVNII